MQLFLLEIPRRQKRNQSTHKTIPLFMSHAEISQYLQCSRQTVTMTLSKMRKSEVIEHLRNEIKILNEEGVKNWRDE